MSTERQEHYEYTAADALVEGLAESGVSHIFANLGSDHPPLIEALAKASDSGRNHPRVIVAPQESVALAAAHGHALLSGQAQAVVVHCDVGTQTLGGAVHNVSRARVPAFVFAGETSLTIEGEHYGTRNRPVQFIQDVADQHSIVRPYAKWSYPMRTGVNAKQLTHRALQLANSDPKGLVYLSGAREVLAMTIEREDTEAANWPALDPPALPDALVEELVRKIDAAEHPLLITSYLGRSAAAVTELTTLAEQLALPVIETFAAHMNFPTEHPLHLGFDAEPLLAQADLIVVLDCDVPWVPVVAKPKRGTHVYHIDLDPLKEALPLWHLPATRACRADGLLACRQLNAAALGLRLDSARKTARATWARKIHQAQRADWALEREDALSPSASTITPASLSHAIAAVIDEETVVLDETITSSGTVRQQLARTRPGTYFQSGGSSLGWHGGAAIGAKLAAPDKRVVALCGDGSFLFSIPSTVHWMTRRYQTPFLTVIYNNGGWNATKQNLLKLHPDGVASATDRMWVNFPEPADYAGIAAAAGGALALRIDNRRDLPDALNEGMDAVRGGRAAVLDVQLPRISEHDS